MGTLEELINGIKDDNVHHSFFQTFEYPSVTPNEISQFLEESKRYNHSAKSSHKITKSLRRLINKSYRAGHNNFFLDTTNTKILDKIGFGVEGTEGNEITININGDVGKYLGTFSKWTNFCVNGMSGDGLGQKSENSSYFVKKNIGEHAGFDSKNLLIVTKEDIGQNVGDSSTNLTLAIDGSITLPIGVDSTGFKSIINLNKGHKKLMNNFENKDFGKKKFKINKPNLNYITIAKNVKEYLTSSISELTFENNLTPQEISDLLQETKEYEKNIVSPIIFTKTINKLVSGSYKAGYNNFYLDYSEFSEIGTLDFVGTLLKGNKNNPLKIILKGDFKGVTLYSTKFVHAGII